KSDALDSERIARETLAHPDLPGAFKRGRDDSGPDETTALIALWHKERRALLKTRQHLLNEADALLSDLPDELRGHLPQTKAVRPRLAALRRSRRAWPAATALRLRLLDRHRGAILELDRRDREITQELAKLIAGTGSPLAQVWGLGTRRGARRLGG